jgi:hypothetical protein
MGLDGGFKHKDSIPTLDSMSGSFTTTSFQTTISKVLEAEAGAVIGSSLLGVGDSEAKMVKAGEGVVFFGVSSGGLYCQSKTLNKCWLLAFCNKSCSYHYHLL